MRSWFDVKNERISSKEAGGSMIVLLVRDLRVYSAALSVMITGSDGEKEEADQRVRL